MKFETKPQIALSQIEAALRAGVAPGVVLADAGLRHRRRVSRPPHRARPDLCRRRAIDSVGLAARRAAACRPSLGADADAASRVRRDADHGRFRRRRSRWRLPADAWKRVAWREGSNQTLSSRFAAFASARPRATACVAAPHPIEWLIVEWPEGEAEPKRNTGSRPCPKTRPIESLIDIDQAALAHRARLRRIEERTRPRPLRRARLARIPPSRQPLHRGLRIPDSRKIRFSPLSPLAPRKTCRFRPYSILTQPPIRPERHVENSIATLRKLLTIALASSLFRCPCCHAAAKRANFQSYL